MLNRDYLLGENGMIMKQIIREICIKYNLTPNQLTGRQRNRNVAWPRQEAYWRCSKETCASQPEIGREFGDRDHTTVAFGIKAHQLRIERAADLNAIVHV